MSAPSEPPAPRPSRLRQVLPFALAFALVALVLFRLDLEAFRRHLGTLDLPAYLAAALVFVLALLAADTFATVLVYRRSVAKIRFRDFFVLRGASYLPSILNHHVGQAFLTYALSRIHGVSLLRVAGSTLLVYASWGGCVLGAASVAVLLSDLPAGWLAAPLGAGLGYLALLAWKPKRLAGTRLLSPLFEAGVTGHLAAMAARMPHFTVLFLGTWLPFRFFGVGIPLASALAYVPILMVAVTLPLTPQGFGTRDALAARFFEPFSPGDTPEARLAALGASTLTWGIAITLVEAAIGLLLTRAVSRRLVTPRDRAE